jgi:putative DNA primase/helicase
MELAAAPLILDPADPLNTARIFVERHYTWKGQRTLYHHGGAFHAWTGSHYPMADEAEIRAALYHFLDKAERPGKKRTPFQPNRTRVGDVLDALRAETILSGSARPPAWLAEAPTDLLAAEMLPCANGLLHLPTLELIEHTPAFFALNALPYAYERQAPEPAEWLRFLGALWPTDREAISTLQEIAGYLLSTDTRQQKLFLLVGPKRSGKGTIARVLTGLLGQENVAGPTLAGLAGNFGLAPLIGRTLAIVSDARLGARADQSAIAERLLSISGEDALTIDRKHLPAWTGRLGTRFLILSNELPRIGDTSGALASRFIVLTLRESFYGREDPGLTDRLLGELPGILNWAIEGWRRLTDRGYFLQPASSADAIDQLEDLASPLSAFLRERAIVAPEREVHCDHLFNAWSDWCKAQGRDHPGTKQTFGRDLRAALPRLAISQPRSETGNRERLYQGIGLQT